MLNIFCSPIRYVVEDVRSLSLPGTYHEKIDSLGISLRRFARLKHLDLSRNAIDNLEVCKNGVLGKLLIYLGVRHCLKDFGSKYEEKTRIRSQAFILLRYIFLSKPFCYHFPSWGNPFHFSTRFMGHCLIFCTTFHFFFLFMSYICITGWGR